MTSPSGPSALPVGVLVPPSTETLVTVGRGQAQVGKVGLQVGGLESAAQLDDPDALARAVEIRGKVVELGDLERRELRAAAAAAAAALVRRPTWVLRIRKCGRACGRLSRPKTPTMMPWRSAGIRIEPGAAAEGPSVGMVVLVERDAEGRAHLGHGSGEPYAPPCLAGLHDRQVMGLGERHDLGDVFGGGPVVGGELLAGQILALVGRSSMPLPST